MLHNPQNGKSVKLCIITIIDYNNYGNRLQNYALYKLLESEGYEVVSGGDLFLKEDWENISYGIKRIIKKCIPFYFYQKWQYRQIYALRESNQKWKNLIAFTEDFIPTLPCFVLKDQAHLQKIMTSYDFDFFIAGSDQIWNPFFAGKDYAFLTFVQHDQRLSFAASFGVDDIPLKQEQRFSDRLSEMRYLSVRETRGAEIIKHLTKREDVDVTMDPTLLLSLKHWEKLVSYASLKCSSHYVAAYFLREVPEVVHEISKKLGLPLLLLNYRTIPDLYGLDPTAFLSVLYHADYVFTDSFHGTCFSIKFHKDFYVFRRKEKKGKDTMFNRVDSLLHILDLQERIQDNDTFHILEPISHVKWRIIDDFLEVQRQRTMEKLKGIMENTEQ